ncbi:MAG: UDP-N-acetylmuramoyl-L-alanyl-D-glutamate--2,6-diaminopimelate ligase [Clostridia bacterium]|nr:UDP-N-acetylmuramoyl-L-alanyl-D-glutamate--2,6-diaminopimelate ligase [Clostridia bacterium]
MKLNDLIKNITVKEIIGSTDVEIENLYFDSNSVTKNSLYFCLNGTKTDGHQYSLQAEKHGAVAVVCERRLNVNVTQIIVESSREAMSIIAGEFYGRADKSLKIIGVTGTNGKTTTTHLIYQILKNAGKNCALIGTLGTFYSEKFIQPTLTTPDPIELNKQLRDMLCVGVEFVVMEVSAHALYFDKVKGIDFTAVIFTNFTQDHLDFFGSMAEYKKAKLKLFREYNFKYSIVNSDDPVGIEIYNEIAGSISYGIDNPADVFAIRVKEFKNGTEFIINLFDEISTVKIPLIGRFNAYNAMSALTASALLGIDANLAVDCINKANCVSGRLEKVHDGEFSVFVDYAHTPDGLQKSLTALRKICNGRLICVFGCGGNRDKLKRSEMGKISGKLADFTIITSDNPRYEEPMEIISDIEKGILKVSKKYLLIQDRTDAIEYALKFAKEKDVVLIAGKGCENYQEILGIKCLYNDKDTVEELLRSNKT